MQINCVASYCACSQSFNRLAHSQSSNVTRTMAGASLYPSIFSFASKPALHYGDVKDEEGKRIVYNITDKHLCSCTVLYDLLSQCSSGRERIGWLLLKFKVNVKQVFLFAWQNLDSERLRRAKKKNSILIFLSRVFSYWKREISLPGHYKTAQVKTGDWEWLWRHFRAFFFAAIIFPSNFSL